MARKHAQYGARRAAEATAAPRTATVEIELPAQAEAAESFGARTPTTEEIETNTFSGPITVPRREPLGDAGFGVHPLALGTGAFGWTLGREAAAEILDRFAGVGGNLVDTADSYAAGRSESILGDWMASRGARDRMRVITRIGRHPDHRGLAPRTIAAAVDDSLARLGTDRIDLLCFHGDDPTVPLEESLGAVDALIGAGKVLAIGASDFSPERLIEARVLAANGLPRFQALTTRYNLLERRAFEGAPELVAHAQGLAVLPHVALANGFLGGGVRRRSDIRRDARGERQARHLGRRGLRVLRALDEVAAAHGSVPAAVAIAWLLARPTVVAPVASASRPEQVDALVTAANLVLHRSEIVELDRASA
ncbi:aryl-alcohol dehydrogenase-like predicted oxidoreductase [Agromyces flavus]|uniref:Predicted oxidoreductase n=1 Tax=Agromyces flavus TaxID=589382 RepID=A0A1H1T5M3_9MICO|nr:aldo/keto reductase [Agromyces flavus]MCP2368487.1 aryl-alcohol dehydrogenase-like predicted oxidoreductase [Agromyces flavus]GGI47947.1 oxidoreductase [Agromyces flavus]SDS55413.1 Predicted oxidoreductase [Agromyces flavus]